MTAQFSTTRIIAMLGIVEILLCHSRSISVMHNYTVEYRACV